jgi:hypothetical protein
MKKACFLPKSPISRSRQSCSNHLALLGLGVGLISGAYLTRSMDEPAAVKRMSPVMGTATDAGGHRTTTLGVMWPF